MSRCRGCGVGLAVVAVRLVGLVGLVGLVKIRAKDQRKGPNERNVYNNKVSRLELIYRAIIYMLHK